MKHRDRTADSLRSHDNPKPQNHLHQNGRVDLLGQKSPAGIIFSRFDTASCGRPWSYDSICGGKESPIPYQYPFSFPTDVTRTTS